MVGKKNKIAKVPRRTTQEIEESTVVGKPKLEGIEGVEEEPETLQTQELVLVPEPPARFSSQVLLGMNLYLAGATYAAAADKAGITRSTLSKALKGPLGIKYTADYYAEVSAHLRGLHVAAVETVAKELLNVDAALRLRAAEMLLKHIRPENDDEATKSKASATEVAKEILSRLKINININQDRPIKSIDAKFEKVE